MSTRRIPAWLGLTVVGLSFTVLGSALEAGAADPNVPITIEGSGDSDILAELTGWQDAMFLNSQPVDIPYYQRGTEDGRAQLLQGLADFTMGGVPFTAAELAARPTGAGAIIAAPMSVSSLSIVMTTPIPFRGGWSTITPKVDPPPECLDPNSGADVATCYDTGQFAGPWRIPADNLSALILELPPTYQNNRLATWKSAGMVAALGTSAMRIQGLLNMQHDFINRSEGSAQNKYLMEYTRAVSPAVWAMKQQQLPSFTWEPIGEQFSARNLSYFGAETVIGRAAFLSDRNGQYGDNWSGNATAVPTTYVNRLLADYPAAGFQVAQIQNKHGDWVSPNATSIGAALAAGTTPNIAATTSIAGGYPLTWVNRLYTVAGTLGPDKANAMAGFIRFAVTDGQAAVVADGGVALTTALRDEALSAADQIVAANCPSATHHVVTEGPAEFEPDLPLVGAIVSVKHCRLTPVVTTTTSPVTTTTVATTDPTPSVVTVASASPTTAPAAQSVYTPSYTPSYSPSYSPSIPFDASSGAGAETVTETTVPPDTTEASPAPSSTIGTATGGTPGGGAGTRPRGRQLDALPLPTPSDGSEGFKKLGTLMLGAGAFLGCKQLLIRRRKAE